MKWSPFTSKKKALGPQDPRALDGVGDGDGEELHDEDTGGGAPLEEKISLSRAKFTGGKSLSELVSEGKSPGRNTKRTPSGRFLRKQHSNERTQVRVTRDAAGTLVTLETAPVLPSKEHGTATVATAAPTANAISRPSQGRAAALGAKPGHFERTNVKKVVSERQAVTIVVKDDQDDGLAELVTPQSRVTIVKQASDRGVAKQDSDKSLGGGDGDASPDSVVGPTDAKSKRELELEKRVAALEESLSQTQVRLSEEQLRLSEQD